MHRERLELVGAQAPCQQRVVADVQVGVQRQVIGGERHVVLEQQPQALLGGGRQRQRGAGPEEAVVDDHEVCVLGGGAAKELRARRDARHDRLDVFGARNLQAIRAVVAEVRWRQQLVEMA
jgi:hypothetical protein